MPDSAKPNVLLVMLDQLRWDCLGVSGNQDVRTPNIDALAEHGVWFENAFCPAPLCTPSRYSLLSGLYPHQHRGLSNRSTLGRGIGTFPRLLRGIGYRTVAVGKMHCTPTYLDTGFDKLCLAEQDGDGRFDDDYHRDLARYGLIDLTDLYDQRLEYRSQAPKKYWDTLGAQPSNLPEEWYSTTWIGNRALEEIDDWKDREELLFVSFIKPHHPFDAPTRWSNTYDPSSLHLLSGWLGEVPDRDDGFDRGYFDHRNLTEPKLRRVMAAYYGSISQVDEQVGRLVRSLRERGLYDDSLIIFTSDHGEYLGFHHMLGKGNHMYDPLVRVPLLVKFPGQRSGSRRCDLVSLVDIGPTVLAQVGLALDDAAGSDLSNGAVVGREAVFAESGKEYLVRTDTAKLLVEATGQEQLFYLSKDPVEMVNRTTDDHYMDLVSYHRNLLYRWLMWESAPRPYHCDEEISIEGDNIPTNIAEQRARCVRYFEQAFRQAISINQEVWSPERPK